MVQYVAGREEEIKGKIVEAKSYLLGETDNGSEPQYKEIEGTSGWVKGDEVASAVDTSANQLFLPLHNDTEVDVLLDDDTPYYRHRRRRNFLE